MQNDITELALIAKIKKQLENFDTLVLKEDEANALVEALEKAQAENTAGVAGMAESYETTISMLRSRIAELERQNSVLADGVIRAEQWLLESRTVTVKLPRPGFVTISGERTAVYLKADVDAAMLAAGIEETE